MVIAKAALLGLLNAVVACTVIFATSERWTPLRDWPLAVMIILTNMTGFAVGAYYRVNLIGVGLAGLIGMFVGSWAGAATIGNYEYSVPTPPEDRILRFKTKEGERIIEMKGYPDTTVKNFPLGVYIGVVVGFAVGAGAYGRLFRKSDADIFDEIMRSQENGPTQSPWTSGP